MPVTQQIGTEYTKGLTREPRTRLDTTEWHGRVRTMFVSHTQVGAGDATSSALIARLPAGRVRLLLPSSFLYLNWTTASAKLDLGWDAYEDENGATVAADSDGLLDGLDVDTAGVFTMAALITGAGVGLTAANGYTRVFSSLSGVDIRATSQDTAIANTNTLAGVLYYVHD